MFFPWDIYIQPYVILYLFLREIRQLDPYLEISKFHPNSTSPLIKQTQV